MVAYVSSATSSVSPNILFTDNFRSEYLYTGGELTGLTGAHSLTIAQDFHLSSAYYYFGIWVSPTLFDSSGNPGLGNNQVWTFTINGSVTSALGVGIELNNYKAAANNIITVGAEGSVTGGFAGIETWAATNVTNSGVIAGEYYAISFYDGGYDYYNPSAIATNLNIAGKLNTIVNNVTGVIESYGVGIDNDSLASLTVTNSGRISGGYAYWYENYYYEGNAAVDSGLGKLTFTNNAGAVIEGNVVSGFIGNLITNAGTIFGTIVSHVDVVLSDPGSSVGSVVFAEGAWLIDLDRDGDFYDVIGTGTQQVNSLVTPVNTINNNAGGVIYGALDGGYYGYDYNYVSMSLSAISDKVTNAGEIYGDIDFRSGNADALTNTGFIDGNVYAWSGGKTIQNTRSLTGEGTIAGDIVSYGKTTLTNSGLIGGDVVLGWIGNTVTNNANSIIQGSIFSFYDSDVGLDRYFSNVLVSGVETLTVDTDQDGLFNDAGGFIAADSLLRSTTVAVNTITNNGTIKADFYYDEYAGDYIAIGLSGGGRDVVTNGATGKIDGSVYLGGGSDSLSNSGVISGFVDMGAGFGTNTVTNTGTTTGGIITGGLYSEATLTLTNSGSIGGSIGLGWIGNSITNSNVIGGAIYSYVDLYDSYSINGFNFQYFDGSVFDLDKDGLFTDTTGTPPGALSYQNFVTTYAVNTITNTGTIYSDLDVVYGEYVLLSLALSQGRDVVTNSGRIDGQVHLFEGNDSLTNQAAGAIADTVNLGTGNNTLSNAGALMWVVSYGSYYEDFFDVTKGTVIVNTGTILGSVDLYYADGNDRVVTTKVIYGNVWTGEGNDNVLVGTGGSIKGYVDLGAGNDTFNPATLSVTIGATTTSYTATTGAVNDYVADGTGSDTINLGAGNDVLYAEWDTDVDTYSGGIGVDKLDLSMAQSGVIVDLDGALGSLIWNFETDTISGFEKIIGSDFADIFDASSIAKQFFEGGGGSDTFTFNALTDSGKLSSARDVILDFNPFSDVIDLSEIDANSSVALDQAFTTIFLGGFTGAAGELRLYYSGSQTIIEGNINNDKIADFSIALQGIYSETDFSIGSIGANLIG